MTHRDDLLRAFGNDADDLEANRRGALGPAQVRRLHRSGWSNIVGALVIGVGLALILAFVADRPLKPVQWLLSLGFFLAVLAVGLSHMRKTRAAAAAGVVEMLAGPVAVRLQRQQGYWINVASRTLKLPVRPWAVESGRSYRVYVAPRAEFVVAMEPDGWE